MPRRVWTVTLYTSAAPSGEGCNGYVAGDFSVDPMVSETALGQFQAATCSFRMRDKLGPKAQRYWSNRIQQSTGTFAMPSGQRTDLPYITVTDATDTDDLKPVFEGWIERNQLQWHNDVVTGFTAVSQLSYMDRHAASGYGVEGDGHPICRGTAGTGTGNVWTLSAWLSGAGDYISMGVIPGDLLEIGSDPGVVIVSVDLATQLTLATSVNGKSGVSYVERRPITTYSGHASPLVRRQLRITGNQSPNLTNGDAPDVVIRDYALGTGQDKTDWNHVLRDWADAGSNPGEVNALSDFVQSVDGNRLGFCCVHGKLYRVDLAPCSGGDTARTTLKLTQITTVPDGETAEVSDGYRLFNYFLADETACLCIVQAKIRPLWTRSENNWLEPITSAGSLVGNIALTARKASLPASIMANAGYMVLTHSLGNATKKITMTTTDSHIRAISRITVMDIGDGTNGAAGVGGTFNNSVATSLHGTSRNIYTLADSVCAATPFTGEASVVYVTVYRQDTNDSYLRHAQWTGAAFALSEPYRTMSGRPAGGMAARSDGAKVFVAIGIEGGVVVKIHGNNNAETMHLLSQPVSRFVGVLPLIANMAVGFVVGSDNTTWLKVSYSGTAIVVSQMGFSGTLPTGFKVACAGVVGLTIETTGRIPIVYKALDSENREYAYAGIVYTDTGTMKVDTTYCPKAIPGALDGDFRPPFIYYDSTAGNPIYRFIVPMARLDGDRLVCDWFGSGDSARAFVHLDLVAEPMSARQVVLTCAQSFGLQLKLLGTAKPSGATLCKVMSRHAWQPHNLGTVTRVAQARDSQIVGTEYYLGAEGNAYGEHVVVGICPSAGERHVFPVGGAFSQPVWLRCLGGWTVNAYPERSATFTNGRRIVETTIHKILGAASPYTPYIPGYDNVYGQATLTLFTVGNITGLMQGLGFGRRTGVYRCRFIEWSATTDTTWTADAVDPTVVECAILAEDTIATPAAVAASSGRIIHWDVMAQVLGLSPHTIGELKLVDCAITSMPDGWYLADGATHNGYVTEDMTGIYVKGGTAAGSGGQLAHQHGAITAGTPAGTIGDHQYDTGSLGSGAVNYFKPPVTGPHHVFVGAELGTHQHPSGTNEPPYLVKQWWQFCGVNLYPSNPVDGSCAWAFTVDICRTLRLKRYGFKLLRAGTATDGTLALALYYDNGGIPGDEIVESRAGLGTTLNGLAAGWHWFDLDTANNGGYTEWEIPANQYWVVPVIDRQDGDGITAPPLVWFDSQVVTPRAKRLVTAVDTSGGTPAMDYFGAATTWDDDLDDDERYAPAIYVGGD